MIYAQNESKNFKEINSEQINLLDKEQKFKALLLDHKKRKDFNALIYDSYGIVKWYFKHNLIDEAIELNKRNLYLMDSVSFKDPKFYRKNIYSLGYYLMSDNQTIEATQQFQKLIEESRPDRFTFNAYYFVAEMTYYSDDYYLATKQFRQAISFAKKHKDTSSIVRNTVGAATVFKEIKTEKSLLKGITLVKDAIELFEPKNENYSILETYYLLDLYSVLGNLHNDRVDYNFEESLKNYNKALGYANKLQDSLRLANVYNDIGYLYLQDSNDAAIQFFDESFNYNPNTSTRSLLHRNKSEFYLKKGNKIEALKSIQQSINELTEVDIKTLTDLPQKQVLKGITLKFELLSSLVDKARIWIDLGKQKPFDQIESYEQAYKTLLLADYLVDIIRLNTNEEQSKLYWRKTASDIYVNATKICYELNYPEEALYFMEKNKALLLLEDLNRKQLVQISKIPEKISKKEAALKNNIIRFMNSESNKDSLLIAKTKYWRFIDSLDTQHQIYYKSQKPAEIITIDTIKENINGNEAYLEFLLDDDKGYGLLITSKDTKLFEVKNYYSLEENIYQLKNLLRKPISSNTEQSEYISVSNNIYNLLIPNQIRPLISNKSLIVIPDHYLQHIPFEALLTNKDPKSYLIFNHKISYAYSISLLESNNRIQRASKKEVIGFAPITFKDLPDLPNSEIELNGINDLFSADSYLKNTATKPNFTDRIHDYKIVHIASHASSNTNDSISPWIAFKNKKLQLQEIYRLKHQAELVVLSACESSLGEDHKGEGMMSLARGFFNSGANSVVSTLWNINDKSSSKIIVDFYYHLKKGKDKSSALHEAKLNYIQSNELSNRSPYYWASFVLIGDTGNIIIEKNTSYTLLTVFAGIMLLILVVTFLIKKR